MVTATREPAGARSTPGPPRQRYWPGLDGLRALAVTAVVVYHLAPGVLPGGFVGVDLFFVISGYLITTLVADERRRTGRIQLVQFWRRRVRRLYPAVLTLLAVVVVVTAVADHAALAESRLTILAALVYLTNWWFIFHHVPYFQRFGPPPLLVHLWSLAIEEQYYLVWPPLLAILLRYWRRPKRIAAAAAGAAVLSAVLMGVVYTGPGSVNRVYYGSDTHAFGLLLGSALALAIPPTGFPRVLADRTRRVLDRTGALALAALVVLMCAMGQADAVTWRGGLAFADLLAGVAVIVGAHPATRLSALLSRRPLRWLGTRSYSVYLWHWPVIVLTAQGGAVPMSGFPRLVVRLILIGGLADASYRWVEQPWRTGRAQARLRRLVAGRPRAQWGMTGGAMAAVAGLVVLASIASVRLPPGEQQTATVAAAAQLPRAPVASPARNPSAGPHQLEGGGGVPPTPTRSSLPPQEGGRVLAIGDSVMLAASADLEQAFGKKITVDAVVGRQVYSGIDRLDQYQRAGLLHNLRALVVGLGSNGPFTPQEMTQLRQIATGIPLVVLVNVRVPDPWQAESNDTIDAMARTPGFAVVNWYGTSADTALLYPDGIHPDEAGQEVYAHLVVKAVTGR